MIATQPQPVRNPESVGYVPEPDKLLALRDKATRIGTQQQFNDYVGLLTGNEATAQMYAEQGLDISTMLIGRAPRDRAILNYGTLQGEDPVDADFGGLSGIRQVVIPKEPAEHLSGGPLPPPTVQPVPGPGSRAPEVFPYVLIGQDGHIGAFIPPDLRGALGSLPDDYGMGEAFEQLMQADFESDAGWGDNDLGRGLRAALGDSAAFVTKEWVSGGRQAADPDGVWAERFGNSLHNIGSMLAGGAVPEGAPAPVKSAADIFSRLGTLMRNGAPSVSQGIGTGLMAAGQALRDVGHQQGSNVGTTEQVGRQLPGPRKVNVGRLQAQEYRALLHDMRREGQLGFSEGMINAIPESQLITQLERMQVLSAEFRREAVVRSGQMWADLAVTLPGMITGSNLLAARLAIPRFVGQRLGPVADVAFRSGLRVVGEATIGGVHGYAVGEGPARMANAKEWAVGGAVVPMLGIGWRGGVNLATGGKYLAFDNMRFKTRLNTKLLNEGMDPSLAGLVSNSFDDWHQKSWMAFGNGNLEQALSTHVIERVAQRAVKDVMLPNASDAAVKEATDKLINMGRIRAEAVRTQAKFEKEVARGILVEDLDPAFYSLVTGIPDPKELKKAFDKLIGSGKTIDRKKYQGLLNYLEKAEKDLPGMRDQLAAVTAFLRDGTTQADGLKASADALRAATGGMSARSAAAVLQKELLTFKAASKAFLQNLNKERAASLQFAKDIMLEAKAELGRHSEEVQAWVKRDPFEYLDNLEAERRAAMDLAAPPEAQAIALQHKQNLKTFHRAKQVVRNLEVRLAAADQKLERAIAKQQKAIQDRIDAANDRVQEIRERGVDLRVQSAIDSDIEYLTAQRDLAIRDAMDTANADWRRQEGIFKRSKNPSVQYRVNDAKQRIIDDRRQWIDWVNSRYEEEMDILGSADYQATLRQEMKPVASADLAEAVAARDALAAKRFDGANRIREAHGKRVTELQQQLDDALKIRQAADDDAVATAGSLTRYGDPDKLSSNATRVDNAYRDRIAAGTKRAEAELTSPEGRRPAGLSAEDGNKLRKDWFGAKQAAAEIRRGVDQADRLGRETIQAAQDDLLRAVTKGLAEAEAVSAKFNELAIGAVRRSDGEGLWRVDRLIRDNIPGSDGLKMFGKVENTFDAASFPLGHTSVPVKLRGELLGKLRKAAKGLGNLSIMKNAGVRIGRRTPRVALRLAEKMSGVPLGSYRSLTDIPVNVAQQLTQVYDAQMKVMIDSHMRLGVANAISEAATFIGELRGNLADEVADSVATLTSAKIAEIETAVGLPKGTLTERGLTTMPTKLRAALEQAYGLEDGTLSRVPRQKLTFDRLTAIEKKNNLAPGDLTTAAGRLKLIQQVAARQEAAIRAMKSAGYSGKIALLNDPRFAAAFANRHANSFSPGRIAFVADEMGLDSAAAMKPGAERTAVVVKLAKDLLEGRRNGSLPDGKNILTAVSRIVNNQLQEPLAARYLLHNFMLLDEVLGGMGLDITPLLDDIRRSVVREQALDLAVTDGVSGFFKSVQMLHYDAEAVTREAQREINQLVTHYRLALENPGDAVMTMEQVMAGADELNLNRETLADAARLGTTAYGDYHRFMREAGYDIGLVEGYASKIEKRVPAEKAPQSKMSRIYNRDTGWFKKTRTEAELANREYDALVLMQRYHEDVKREHILGDAIRKSKGIENTLRELVASADDPTPKILGTFTDVMNYAQGINRKTVMYGLRWLFRGASRLNALRLSSPKTAMKQFADPAIVVATLAPRGVSGQIEHARIVAKNMVHGKDPKWDRIAGYLDLDGIGGGDYRVWDNYGMQSHELMSAAQEGVPIQKSSWIDTKLVHTAMKMMHGADRSGRLTAAAVGEEISERALASTPKGLPVNEAFKVYRDKLGTRFLSKGQWDSSYHAFSEAYKGGNILGLHELVGGKVSQTVMFDYFPGSGSSITRNPYLRQAIPFYSYAGARNMLLLRSLARNEGVGSVLAAGIFEGVALGARYGALGKGLAAELSMLGGLGSYAEYVNDPFSPWFDKDKTTARAFLQVAGGPGVGGIANLIVQTGRVAWAFGEMQFTDMEKVYDIAVYAQKFPNKDYTTKGERLYEQAEKAARQLGSDTFDAVVRSVGVVNYARGVVEGLSDERVWDDPKWFSDIDKDDSVRQRRQDYDDEMTFYQLLIYNFIKSSSKPMTDKNRAAIKEALGVDLDPSSSAIEQADLVLQSFGSEFRQQMVRGRGAVSKLALEGGMP